MVSSSLGAGAPPDARPEQEVCACRAVGSTAACLPGYFSYCTDPQRQLTHDDANHVWADGHLPNRPAASSPCPHTPDEQTTDATRNNRKEAWTTCHESPSVSGLREVTKCIRTEQQHVATFTAYETPWRDPTAGNTRASYRDRDAWMLRRLRSVIYQKNGRRPKGMAMLPLRGWIPELFCMEHEYMERAELQICVHSR